MGKKNKSKSNNSTATSPKGGESSAANTEKLPTNTEELPATAEEETLGTGVIEDNNNENECDSPPPLVADDVDDEDDDEDDADEDDAEENRNKDLNDNSSPPTVTTTNNTPQIPPTPSNPNARREEKDVEEVLKSLSSHGTTEEKLKALCSKHATLLEESRLNQRTLKQTNKQYSLTIREKDQIHKELKKTIAAKVKMEALCRELQKVNKTIKEDSLNKIKEQESRRQELSDKFKETLAEIHETMNSGRERSERLSDENKKLSIKLQALVEQYEAKEVHTKKLCESRDLSIQLLEAKLKSAQLKLDALSTASMQDKQNLIGRVKDREAEVKNMLDVETKLRAQLDLYQEKYNEFQANLTQSNDSFATFKAEMGKMNEKMAAVESDANQWKEKFNESMDTLNQMDAAKTQCEKRLGESELKLETFEKLTRALQDERASLLKEISDMRDKLTEAGIVAPPTSTDCCSGGAPCSEGAPQPPSSGRSQSKSHAKNKKGKK